MRRFLDNNQQVAHYFANSVQSEGRGSNFYFETDRNGECYLFSYGRHFAIARRLSANVFSFTTRRYGQATSKHLAYARSALIGKTLVYCEDPMNGAATNKREAQAAIDTELRNAETSRKIRQATRDGHKAQALRLAEQFNAYLAALPESERAEVTPFDVSGLDAMRAALAEDQRQKEEAERKRKEAAAIKEREYLDAWRNDPTMYTQGMLNSPIALRLKTFAPARNLDNRVIDGTSRTIVETSRGAQIPVEHAVALWPVVVSVKTGERSEDEAVRLVRRLGVYNLDKIRKDGSIVVGCHDIGFSELVRMAVALELVTHYRVTMRSRTTGGTDTDTMRVWPGADIELEAARMAGSYGADVEKVEPILADEVKA